MSPWINPSIDELIDAYNLKGVHPAADLFPLIEGDEYQALCDSVNVYGLEQPVVLTHDGYLLDGRNRLRALYATGQTERFTTLGEAYAKDYYGYACRLNLDRRHLTTEQKKAVYLKLREIRGVQKAGGDRKSGIIVSNDTMIGTHHQAPVSDDDRLAALYGGPEDEGDEEDSVEPEAPSQAQYAEELGVSRPTVARWEAEAKVLDEVPEIKAEVLEGRKPVKQAVAEAKAEREKPKPKAYITLSQWKERELDEVEWPEDSAATFNKQDNDSIEWADWSWNPVTGCKHECSYCYARDIALRFWGDSYGFEPTLHPERLMAPYNTKLPKDAETSAAARNVFANSMSDLYGQWVPKEWIYAVFQAMEENPQWNFLTLTKFPKRAAKLVYPENVWIGTSVDLQARVKSAEDAFEKIQCGVRWLSIEPMLEPLKFDRPELFDWVVIGGASPSSKTPAWTPPAEWLIRVAAQFLDHGAKIYLKTNGRPREFPGLITPETADEAFKYLGT